MNTKVYGDKTNRKGSIITNFTGGYLSTAESKIAPLLVSGSWVGWLMDMLTMTLPSRFKFYPLDNLPEHEAFEMIFKYSMFFDVPVTEETAFLIAQITEGSPFYINALFCSEYPDKNLNSMDGLLRTLSFETLNDRGDIKFTWMEYLASALPRINDKNAKNIVLYLCQNRNREVTRRELLEKLNLNLTDGQLEKRLKALVKSDIIKQGSTNFDYQGVTDNIFDKVFRGIYQKEIEHFEPGLSTFSLEQIIQEYQKALEEKNTLYNQLQGKYNYQKGYFAEYLIIDQLRFHGLTRDKELKEITHNLPADFNFCSYSDVWTYRLAVAYNKGLSVDILARASSPGEYSLIGEIKNRDIKKFSIEEATAFLEKFAIIKETEKLNPVIGFVFSRSGFTEEATAYLQDKGISFSEDKRWLDV